MIHLTSGSSISQHMFPNKFMPHRRLRIQPLPNHTQPSRLPPPVPPFLENGINKLEKSANPQFLLCITQASNPASSDFSNTKRPPFAPSQSLPQLRLSCVTECPRFLSPALTEPPHCQHLFLKIHPKQETPLLNDIRRLPITWRVTLT